MAVAPPARSADDDAFAALYAGHWTVMVRLAWLLLHDQAEAEEVAQNAFIAVHRKWPSLIDTGRAPAYLRCCVVNGARSALRHRSVVRRHAATAVAPLVGPDDPVDAAVRQERRDTLLGLLAGLPRRQQEVLVLRYWLDLDEAGIADALGISTGSVKSHAHRGLRALQAASTGEDL